MSAMAAMVERMEQIGEHRGRNGLDPNHAEALDQVMRRFPDGRPLVGDDVTLLFLRFWMHYAAGVKHPEEATDVTLRAWRGED